MNAASRWSSSSPRTPTSCAHNFDDRVAGHPGKTGMKAEEFATSPGAPRHSTFRHMPAGVVLFEEQTAPAAAKRAMLKFTAPEGTGHLSVRVHLPGHWRRMHGAHLRRRGRSKRIRKTRKRISRRTALTVKDDLLKFNRPHWNGSSKNWQTR